MGKLAHLSGSPWHVEYHTVEHKKAKAADCIFLDEERICNCKKCPTYLALCFEASICHYRVKEANKDKSQNTTVNTNQKDINEEKPLTYLIPKGTQIKTRKGSGGIIKSYEIEKKHVIVEFENDNHFAKYPYPDAFINGFLIPSEEILEKIKKTYK